MAESTTRYFDKLAMLAKLEATYGVDAAPTGAANAMLMTNVKVTHLADELSRELLLPYFGLQGVILTGRHIRIEGEIEVAGSGTAGTLPAFGPLLSACGMAAVVVEGVSVTYSPVSGGFTSASIYYNRDGERHIALGARGNVTWSFVPRQIPRFKFSLLALEGTIADQVLPEVDVTDFVTPVPVSRANTTFSLHGVSPVTESVEFDLGQKVEPRFLIGEDTIKVTGRGSTGKAVLQAGTLAEKDWYAIAGARTRAALSLTHGTVAGNIVTVAAPAVEVGLPEEGETQKIVNRTLGLGFVPVNGNDELTIAFT
jgi:hypothetical protein